MPFTTENCFQGRICIRHMIQYALYMKLTGSRSAGRGIPHLSGGQIVLAKEKCLIFLLRYNVPLQQQLHINRVSLHFQLRPAYFHFSCISSLQLLIPDVAHLFSLALAQVLWENLKENNCKVSLFPFCWIFSSIPNPIKTQRYSQLRIFKSSVSLGSTIQKAEEKGQGECLHDQGEVQYMKRLQLYVKVDSNDCWARPHLMPYSYHFLTAFEC